MPTTPKNTPPSTEELFAHNAGKRQSSKLYKSETYAFNAERISEITGNTKTRLEQAVISGKISLSDTMAVKQQATLYLDACEQSATLPSITGLALALGYSRRAIYNCINRGTPYETAHFLELFRDACSEALEQASLQNSVNTIAAIFIQKAIYQLRETVEVAVSAPDPLGAAEVSPEEIAQRYIAALPDADYDD